jgi:hypothetical protein
MAGKRQPKAKAPKPARKKPEDTTVHVPLSFEEAIDAFLRVPPPSKKK